MVPAPPPPEGLTQLQARFAECYVANGDGNATQAAREAGYSESSAKQVGYRLLRSENVMAYIMRLTQSAMASTAPIALATMLKLASGARSEFVRQAAASDLLDRAGFKPQPLGVRAGSGSVKITIDLGD